MSSMEQNQAAIPESTLPFRSFRIPLTGWTASLFIHLILIAIFLVSRTETLKAPQSLAPPPLAVVESPIDPLQNEPLISDLKIAPGSSSPSSLPPLPQLAPPIPVPALPASTPPSLVSPAPQAQFAIPDIGSPIDPYQTSFCGSSAKGDNICYVVDCSGSMVIAFDYIRRELHRSIQNLNPAQCFQIIFFSGHDPIPMPPQTLLRATTSNVLAAKEFIRHINLEKVPSSEAAWKSIASALAMSFRTLTENPLSANASADDVIYLLTDGEYDHQQVKNALDRLQALRTKKVAIHVIACGNQNNEKFLRQLAASHHGTFTFVSDEQLARQGKDNL